MEGNALRLARQFPMAHLGRGPNPEAGTGTPGGYASNGFVRFLSRRCWAYRLGDRMKIQYLQVFVGPPYELEKVRIPSKIDVPDGVDPQSIISQLYGSNWVAQQIQILGAL